MVRPKTKFSSKRLEKDAYLLEDLAGWIRSYEYKVNVCGVEGLIEDKEIQERIPQVLKVLVRHLDVPSKEIDK